MSVTFLVIILFILAVTVFILAFREPLSKMDFTGQAPASSATSRPLASPAGGAEGGNQPRSTPKALVVDGGSPSAPPASPSPVPPAPTASPAALPAVSASPAAPAPAASVPAGKPAGKPSTVPAVPGPGGKSPSPAPAAGAVPVASANPAASLPPDLKSVTLYFTRVQDDGRIGIEKVSRSVSFTESPLVSSIRALLRGPAGTELSQGLVSMIPAGTTLLKAWVQDSVAYLNFSESFMFNPLGGDGLRAQVRQVVWVATEFPTVKAVQILIEGRKEQYLGGDNVEVGRPLTRKSLP
jgi:hypothetical protein